MSEASVDRDDLLKVLQAASAVKKLLTLFNDDKMSVVDAAGAIDRLTRDYNISGRAPLPEPGADEINELRRIFAAGFDSITVNAGFIRENRSLLAKGLIEFGVARATKIWTTSGDVETMDNPMQLCRLTPRGKKALRGGGAIREKFEIAMGRVLNPPEDQ